MKRRNNAQKRANRQERIFLVGFYSTAAAKVMHIEELPDNEQ